MRPPGMKPFVQRLVESGAPSARGSRLDRGERARDAAAHVLDASLAALGVLLQQHVELTCWGGRASWLSSGFTRYQPQRTQRILRRVMRWRRRRVIQRAAGTTGKRILWSGFTALFGRTGCRETPERAGSWRARAPAAARRSGVFATVGLRTTGRRQGRAAPAGGALCYPGLAVRLPGLGGALAVLPVAPALHGRARLVLPVPVPVTLRVIAASGVVRSRRLLRSLALSVLPLGVPARLVPVLLPAIRPAIPVVPMARGGGVLPPAFLSLAAVLRIVVDRGRVGLRAGHKPVDRLLLDAPADQPLDRRPAAAGRRLHQRYRFARSAARPVRPIRCT